MVRYPKGECSCAEVCAVLGRERAFVSQESIGFKAFYQFL